MTKAGETVFYHGPVGRHAEAWVVTSGPIGAKEVGNLIALLRLQMQWLEEDEVAPDDPPPAYQPMSESELIAAIDALAPPHPTSKEG